MVKSEKFIRKIYQKIFRILVKSENFIRKIYQKNLSENFIRKFFVCPFHPKRGPGRIRSFLLGPDSFFLFLVSRLALPSESVSESVGKRKQAEIYLAYRIYTFIFLYVFYIYPHCKNHIPSL